MAEASSTDERKTNVFISYSRKDGEAADRLHEALETFGFNSYLDKHDIAAGEDWRARLGALIQSADTIVFLISPDSVASEICDWEINHAELLGKRVLPVLVKDTPSERVPERLKRLNYVFMRGDAEAGASLGVLAKALETDIAWVRQHSRYGEIAGEWDRAGRPARLLLRGASIGEAERWRDSRASAAPDITATQSSLISASRRAATARQRGWIVGSLVIAVVTIGLAIYSLIQQQAAEINRRETVDTLAQADYRQGTVLADEPDSAALGIAYLGRATRAGSVEAGTRLLTMLQQRSFWLPDGDAEYRPPEVLDHSEIAARFASVDLDGTPTPTQSVAVSADGQRVFTAVAREGQAAALRLWSADGTPLTDWFDVKEDGPLNRFSAVIGHLSAQGRYLAIESNSGFNAQIAVVELDRAGTLQRHFPYLTLPDMLEQGAVAGFSFVKFSYKPGETDWEGQPTSFRREAAPVLLLGSPYGDAAGFEFFTGLGLYKSAGLSRRSRIVDLTLDDEQKRLFVLDSQGRIAVAQFYGSEPVGNILAADPAATRFVAVGDRLEVAVAHFDQVFALAPPRDVAAAAGASEAAAPPDCFEVSGMSQWEPTPDITVSFPDSWQSVTVTTPTGTSSRTYHAPVSMVCLAGGDAYVAVTLSDYRTYISTLDLNAALGPAIDDGRDISSSYQPLAPFSVELSQAAQMALVATHDPSGTFAARWYRVWSVANGLPLSDRIFLSELGDGPRFAGFSADGAHLVLLDEAGAVMGTIRLALPAGGPEQLAAYLEAAADARLADGVAVPVPERNRELAAGPGDTAW